jgi:hypothetical protein
MSTVELRGRSSSLESLSSIVAPQTENQPSTEKHSRGDLFGHTSLYLVFFSFVMYKAWQISFEYPPSVQVYVPGIGSLDAKTWSALIHGLGGWLSLSAVVSLAQPGRFVRNLLRPLYAIDDEYIRKVFRNPVALMLALVIFVITLLIVTCNVAVQISSEYEVIVCLPTGHGFGKLVTASTIGEEIRLAKGESARLLLRGWRAPEVVLIRDRYNLTTLEALEVRRSWASFAYQSLPLKVHGNPVKAFLDGSTSLEKISWFGLSSRGALSFSDRAVLMAMVADDGVTLYSGRLLVGEPDDGPEDPPNTDPSVTLFFKDLWTARDHFATWTNGHQRYVERAGLVLHHPTQNYNNRIMFAEGSIEWNEHKRLAETKEAIFIISRKTNLPPTQLTLTTALSSFEPNPTYRVVGLMPNQKTQTKHTP